MSFEKRYKSEDGTYTLLKAKSEEELARWDLEVSDVGKSIRDWMVVEDFVRFSNAYESLRPHFLKDNFYDLRYQCSPSLMRAMKEELSWKLNLLRLWHKHLEVAYRPEPKKQVPEHKPRKRKKRELTISHELARLESMSPNKRADYLENKPELTEPWIEHLIEKRRAEEARAKQQEKAGNIRRYKQTAKLEATKLSEKEKSEDDLRGILEKWVQQRRTR